MKTIMDLVLMAQRAMVEQTGKPATEIQLTRTQFVALLAECDKKYGSHSPKGTTQIKLDGVLIVIRAETLQMVAERTRKFREQCVKAGYKTHPPFEDSVFDTDAFRQQQAGSRQHYNAYQAQAQAAQARQQQYQHPFGDSINASYTQQQQEMNERYRAQVDAAFYNPFYRGRDK